MKMLVIGLGKHQGAILAHRASVDVGLARRASPRWPASPSSKLPILFGLGTRGERAAPDGQGRGHAARGAGGDRGPAARRRPGALLGRIPFDFLHLLIVDEMGKEISGTGMDPNVLGRMYFFPNEEPKSPRYIRILVRDLTEKTAGNAVGMGLADFATRRLANKVNFQYTYTNALTGLSPDAEQDAHHLRDGSRRHRGGAEDDRPHRAAGRQGGPDQEYAGPGIPLRLRCPAARRSGSAATWRS